VEAAPLQFADWASWERGQSHPAEARSYWRDTLDGFSPSSGLADRPRAPGSDGYVAGEVVPDPLSSALADVLERHGRPHGVGLHGALLAALIVALSFSSDRDDFTIGVIDGNRDRPECEALLGCLASLVLLRVALEPELSFRELLRRTGSAWRRARRHKVPLEQQLPDGWTRPLEPSDPPICEVKFNYLPAPATSGRETWTELAPGLHVHTFSPDVKRRTWSSPSSWFGTLLTVTVWRRPDAQLGLVLGYNQSRLSPERVAGVARGLSAVLRLAATHPELSLRELSRRVAACGVAEGER
jgi:non-ribosomal peptide synthetase component F